MCIQTVKIKVSFKHTDTASMSTQAKNTNFYAFACYWLPSAVLRGKIHQYRERYLPKPEMLICTKDKIKLHRNLALRQRESSFAIEIVLKATLH